MGFKYPADPADGDIIVRGDLLGTYDANTDTWAVGQLDPVAGIPGPVGPEGDPGPQGIPGQGLEIAGTVAGLGQLPASAEINDIYITLDNGHGNLWDGTQWIDLGEPIQGPQGIQGIQGIQGFQGAPGEKGAQGDQGIQGIQGIQGESGSLEVASATNLGGIKIGRGLDIWPDGTAHAKAMDVVIETAPIPTSEVRPFQPHFLTFGAPAVWEKQYRTDQQNYYNETVQWEAPPSSNSAMVWYFCSSIVSLAAGWPNPSGQWVSFPRIYIGNVLSMTGGDAVFESNGNPYFGVSMSHNASMIYSADIAYNAANPFQSIKPTMKMDMITYTQGAVIDFNVQVNIHRSQWAKAEMGGGRLIILPFINKEGQNNIYEDDDWGPIPDPATFATGPYNAGIYSSLPKTWRTLWDVSSPGETYDPQVIPDETTEQRQKADSVALKAALNGCVLNIDQELEYISDHPELNLQSTADTLVAYRIELEGLRSLPGSFSVINSELERITAAVNTIIDYEFRFEVT